jgi:hypothetical protein
MSIDTMTFFSAAYALFLKLNEVSIGSIARRGVVS